MGATAAELSDEELARRAGRGDVPAFEGLVRRYGPRLIGFLRRAGAKSADDAAQEVWLRVWRALPRWKVGHFRGWLFTIARNLTADAAHRPPEPVLGSEVVLLHPAPPPADGHADTLARLRACLDKLRARKPDFHAAVVLQMEGRSLKEIAAAQGKADDIDTIKTRIHRGKKALRRCVGGNEP